MLTDLAESWLVTELSALIPSAVFAVSALIPSVVFAVSGLIPSAVFAVSALIPSVRAVPAPAKKGRLRAALQHYSSCVSPTLGENRVVQFLNILYSFCQQSFY